MTEYAIIEIVRNFAPVIGVFGLGGAIAAVAWLVSAIRRPSRRQIGDLEARIDRLERYGRLDPDEMADLRKRLETMETIVIDQEMVPRR
jgi:hypothetical protein